MSDAAPTPLAVHAIGVDGKPYPCHWELGVLVCTAGAVAFSVPVQISDGSPEERDAEYFRLLKAGYLSVSPAPPIRVEANQWRPPRPPGDPWHVIGPKGTPVGSFLSRPRAVAFARRLLKKYRQEQAERARQRAGRKKKGGAK